MADYPKLAFPPGPPHAVGTPGPQGLGTATSALRGCKSASGVGSHRARQEQSLGAQASSLPVALPTPSASLPVAANVASAGAWTSMG